MESLKLSKDGDGFEQKYWNLFINNQFPSYETFWLKFIIPLTNRPNDIHFKTDSELTIIDHSNNDICIAQLHYTVLRHLIRVFDIARISNLDIDQFVEAVTRLCCSLDVADELLERFGNKSIYDPWSEKDGQNARHKWRINHKDLNYLREYRNKLLHGRITSSIIITGTFSRLRIPKFNKVNDYLDWREVTNYSVGSGGEVRNDFDSPNNLINYAWKDSINYLENSWKENLLYRKNR